ncbi:DUF3185 family protein [Psychromonas sp.]|nr:DUF3185 family protein [Psychromonas sp.]
MNQKIIAIALIIIGTALAMWGYNVFNSASAQISRALNGYTPDEAWIAMVGGAICILIGAMRLK